MVFVDSISELEYYSPNPQWGCYNEPVFVPHDILLQANGFTLSGTPTVLIEVCTPAGTLIEDATTYFDYFFSSFVISGTTYYFLNLRCDHYSPGMLSNKCFVLHVVVSDGSTVVFNKYTQKYFIANSGSTFAAGVTFDDGLATEVLAECVPAADSANCDWPYLKFACAFDCVDSFNGDFYQEGTVSSGYGNYPFNFIRSSWIEGRIRKVPNAIKRTVSINCRTQKTETTPKYLLTGATVFPAWKMEEIENMLLANHLYVGNTEYQSEGGTIFEQFGRPFNCQYVYKLTMPLQKCFKWQIFGCVPTCEALATYYMFPRTFERLYDDSERLIATTTEELAIYFGGLEGVSEVAELPFVLDCPVEALVKVQSTGVLPKYIYVDELAPAARIFPKQLAADTANLEAMCNGVTANNQVPIPDVQGGENQAINVPVPDVQGGENQDYNDYILQITGQGDWALDGAYSSAAAYDGEVTLNISALKSGNNDPIVSNTIALISGDGRPVTTRVIYGNDNPNLPPTSILTINTDGTIVYTGPATLVDGGVTYLEFFMVKYLIG